MSDLSQQPVLLEIVDSVAYLTLNRPDAGNSLSFELVTTLQHMLAELAPRRDVKVIIINGAGGRIFSAGHDLNEFSDDPDRDFLERDFAGIASLMQDIIAQPQIVIAKVAGIATAAGCELVAACDIAITSQDARFGLPGVNIGFWCHTPQVLVSRQVGRKEAMMMLATGQLFSAEHALRIGLVNRVVQNDSLDATVAELAFEIGQRPCSVLRAGKASFVNQSQCSIADAYDWAREAALENIQSDDAQEGIAAFLAKRSARWTS